MSKFDLHLHTNNSDGSDSTEELIKKVLHKGINIFSITDHDTVQGVLEAEKLTSKETKFIKGIELTCQTDGINCHILGYYINPYNEELTKLIESGKIMRRKKLETRIKYLNDVWGIELDKNELNWLYTRKSVVKTHLANILVNRGLSTDNVSAMKKYLDGCKTGNTKFDGYEGVNIIKSAGGIAVWAHPLGGEGEAHINESELLQQLETMKKSGIQGLECYYSRYNLKEIELLKKVAIQNDLFITGGSDYHGSNKTVALGQLNSEGIFVDSKEIKLNK